VHHASAKLTVVRRRKVNFVEPSLANEIGLHGFKPFALSDDIAVQRDARSLLAASRGCVKTLEAKMSTHEDAL